MTRRRGRGNTAYERVLHVLKEYGEPMTSVEVAALLDIPVGTVGSAMSKLTDSGEATCIFGRRPYRYAYNPNGTAGARNGVHADTVPNLTPPPAPAPAPAPRDPWYDVTAKWRSVFGISITTEDAELMVALANREIEKARREAID